MITHGKKQISEIVYARKASEGGGAVRLTNIIRGAQVVFGGLYPDVKGWLTKATRAAILAAFGQTDGKAVIKATNAYLNALAATDKTKASAIAGFINHHPLDAALYGGLYVQDGLVFQMDRAYECTSAKWTDFISGVEFNGNGSVQIDADNVPTFNGSSSYKGQEQNHAFETHTIEVVISSSEAAPTSNLGSIYYENSLTNKTTRFGVGALDSNRGITFEFATTIRYWKTQYGGICSFACANNTVYKNGIQLTQYGSTGTTVNHESGTFIGCRYTNNAFLRATKIYGIRIYNRLLTEAEILANQDIDIKRFTKSTP